MNPTRRTFLGGAGALALGASAGCVDDIGAESDDEGAYTAFFTLEAFTRRVAGDGMSVQNPIPAGEMGHRYEVGTDAQVDAARSRAFVYLDVVGFQRWALDAANNLQENHPEVTVVDALEDVDLLEFESQSHDEHSDDNGDHDEHSDEHDDSGHDGHGDFDPHYWLDPIRAARSVGTIADGLAEADPDEADTYEANAEAYRERLEGLDETFREELSGRELDTIVVAGHDSYQYLAARYDFEVHSPVGVSPNAEPGSSEIADTIEVVDERDVDVVLYDAFDSSRLAETIVSDSGASEAVPLSPLEGTTPEWDDEGWGYVEQMKEINLPALKAALKSE